MHDGEFVLIDWLSGLKFEIFKKFTTPGSAKPLVNLSPGPVFTEGHTGMAVNKLAPWAEKMDMAVLW